MWPFKKKKEARVKTTPVSPAYVAPAAKRSAAHTVSTRTTAPTTVINNHANYYNINPDDDMLTGVVVGGMIGGTEGAVLGGMLGGVGGGLLGGEIAELDQQSQGNSNAPFQGFEGGSSGGAGVSGDIPVPDSTDPGMQDSTPSCDTSSFDSSYDSSSSCDTSSSFDSGSSSDSSW